MDFRLPGGSILRGQEGLPAVTPQPWGSDFSHYVLDIYSTSSGTLCARVPVGTQWRWQALCVTPGPVSSNVRGSSSNRDEMQCSCDLSFFLSKCLMLLASDKSE